MKKLFNIIIAGALATVSLTSCQRDLTSLNEDPKHPTVLPSQNLLAMGQQQFFYYTFTGSVNFNNFRFFVQQWAETTYTDETNYDLITRNQPRNNWNRMYVYSLNNYEMAKTNLENELGNTETVKQNKWATLEISQIAVWETLVDTYGNIPYTQAIQAADGQFAPVYDDAKTIYSDLLSRIDAAVAKIDVSEDGYSDGDLVYGGDMTKWKHFANSIKLRLAMNLADVDAATSKAAAESAIASGVISSEDESYNLVFDGGTFSNPIYDDLVASGRNDFVPTEFILNKMNDAEDPRRGKWFTKASTKYKVQSVSSSGGNMVITFVNDEDNNVWEKEEYAKDMLAYYNDATTGKTILLGNITDNADDTITVISPNPDITVKNGDIISVVYYKGGVFGELNPFGSYSHMSDFFLGSDAPANLLSYTEVLFLKAEAAARGYSVGGSAESFYKAAIAASMSENGVASADADAYIAAHPYDAANWKKSIGGEAYIALFNRAFAAWNFTRRLDYPVLVNPADSQLDAVPTRMPYSDQEYVLNKTNVEAAASAIGGDKATTKLFWDVH